MSNNKNEEKEKGGGFNPGCVVDIQDKLLSNNYVLKFRIAEYGKCF